jgi:septal ring factor EnvC (AmiA/AmiB activator)
MKARAIGVVAIALLPGAALPGASPTASRPDTKDSLARLLAAQIAAQPPVIATLVQPGSIADMVHLRAALAGVRSELAMRIARERHSDAPGTTSVYRLPVAGRLITGFGTVSEAGVRSRGLTFAVAPGAAVVAPAAGVVRYAQAFRGYGGTVIVDHGAGWTSVLTGLGTLAVRPGGRVRAGAAIGTARRGERRQVTVELRRRGEPVDAAPLIR